MLAAIVKKKRISKGFTDDLCSTTVQVDLISNAAICGLVLIEEALQRNYIYIFINTIYVLFSISPVIIICIL